MGSRGRCRPARPGPPLSRPLATPTVTRTATSSDLYWEGPPRMLLPDVPMQMTTLLNATKARTSQFLLMLLLLLGFFGLHIFFLSRSLRTSQVSTTAPSERYIVARRLKIWSSHVTLLACSDEVAEWLRRWTANPLCSARVGSNPILVVCSF